MPALPPPLPPIEVTINKLKKSGPKFNIEQYFFRQTKTEYLGLWVTRDVVKPIDKYKRNNKYYTINLSKRSASVYGFSELLS